MSSVRAGTAIASLDGLTKRDVKVLLEKLEEILLPGRTVMFYWTVAEIGASQVNWEYIISDLLLLSPNQRDSNTVWEFTANGALRGFAAGVDEPKTLYWLIVRCSGPKSYTRKSQVDPLTLKKSQIPVTDYAFTRDVANNVWHTDLVRMEEILKSRYLSLTSWSDEPQAVYQHGGFVFSEHEPLDLQFDPIPKALRVQYPA